MGSVVHAHPPTATAFAIAHIPLNEMSSTEAIMQLGIVPVAEYGTPSTAEVPAAVRAKIGSANALLLANHGALTIGKTLMEAYFAMETLEHFAAISLYARLLGGAKELDAGQVRELFRVRAEVFGKEGDIALCMDSASLQP